MTTDGTLGRIPSRYPCADRFGRLVNSPYLSKGGPELVPDGSNSPRPRFLALRGEGMRHGPGGSIWYSVWSVNSKTRSLHHFAENKVCKASLYYNAVRLSS